MQAADHGPNDTSPEPLGVKVANSHIQLLTDFFNWLGRDENPRARKFNPQYQENQYDRRIDQQAYSYPTHDPNSSSGQIAFFSSHDRLA